MDINKETKFYHCEICKKVIEAIHNPGVPTICCGESMKNLIANTVDAATEKHVPVYEVDEEKGEIIVQVGSVEHPMTDEHHIMWIAQETENTMTRVDLVPGERPIARLKYIPGSTIYEYCNLHGLWSTKVI